MSHTPSPEKSANNKKRRKILTILLLTFGLIAVICFSYWFIWGRFKIYTDDAYVSGNIVRIMPQISGTVTSVNTDNALFVTEGQVLATLDKADKLIELERAEATLAQTVREVRQLYENVTEAKSNVILNKANFQKAELDLKRRQGLVKEKAISSEEMQHYQVAYASAQAKYDYSLARYNTALAQVKNISLYQHPLVKRAKANLKNTYLNFQRTIILAPTAGYIVKRSVQVGEHVTPNTALMAIIPLDQVWIDANYKESQLERLRVGQAVSVVVDAYSGTEYHGKILGLTAGTGSTFDLLPPQNATGNWIKIVQRVPVRIILDKNELKKHPLVLGLSVRATTQTHTLDGDILNKFSNQKVLYSTAVFNKQLVQVDHLINTILETSGPDIKLKSELEFL
jgi:membrane fusion protein (multidrug efflux system)